MSRRVLPAIIVSSATTSAACVIGLLLGVSFVAGADTGTAQGVGHGAPYFFLLGWPIALLVTLVVAKGSTYAPARWRPVSALSVCTWAAITGAIVLPLVWKLFGPASHVPWQMVPIGAVAAVAGGACFWLISQPHRG